jgi:hypothetical protein
LLFHAVVVAVVVQLLCCCCCFAVACCSCFVDRVGSEFWKLPERLGDEETGME